MSRFGIFRAYESAFYIFACGGAVGGTYAGHLHAHEEVRSMKTTGEIMDAFLLHVQCPIMGFVVGGFSGIVLGATWPVVLPSFAYTYYKRGGKWPWASSSSSSQ